MATAVKTTQETAPRTAPPSLLASSLVGAAYVLFSVWLVFAGLPWIWTTLGFDRAMNPFLSSALLLLITVVLVPVLVLGGRSLEGTAPPRGARAGAFILAGLFFLIVLVTFGIMNNWFVNAGLDQPVGLGVTAALGLGLLFGLYRIATKPGFAKWLVETEENGWFHATSYKGNQGLRVRRGTVVGLLVVAVCGIYVMVQHGSVSKGDWEVLVPFTEGTSSVIFMHRLNMVLPIVLGFLAFWFAWRVVNWPKFADFLIATEAEMNKVSWTTRKRLFQDTVVVLVTVVLLTTFLFVVDILWIKILSNPFLRVLDVDPMEERAKQNVAQQW
jgi:preprotein translocase SecE subunit